MQSSATQFQEKEGLHINTNETFNSPIKTKNNTYEKENSKILGKRFKKKNNHVLNSNNRGENTSTIIKIKLTSDINQKIDSPIHENNISNDEKETNKRKGTFEENNGSNKKIKVTFGGKPPEIGKLTFKEAAIIVLSQSDKLMDAKQIVAEALRQNLVTTTGKTPTQTLTALINTDIHKSGKQSLFRKFGNGQFSIRHKFVEHITNNVLEPEEQENGMILLSGSALKYVPYEKEKIWLGVGESQIPDSGFGLYSKRKITIGTVFSEYRGIMRDIQNTDADIYPYGVSVHAEGRTQMVDGIDDEGNVLSLAPRANDCSPKFQNAMLLEYNEWPERVFFEATRDIEAGEEIFTIYGCAYWGFEEYPDWPTIQDYAELPNYATEQRETIKKLKFLDSEIEKITGKHIMLDFSSSSSSDDELDSFSDIFDANDTDHSVSEGSNQEELIESYSSDFEEPLPAKRSKPNRQNIKEPLKKIQKKKKKLVKKRQKKSTTSQNKIKSSSGSSSDSSSGSSSSGSSSSSDSEDDKSSQGKRSSTVPKLVPFNPTILPNKIQPIKPKKQISDDFDLDCILDSMN